MSLTNWLAGRRADGTWRNGLAVWGWGGLWAAERNHRHGFILSTPYAGLSWSWKRRDSKAGGRVVGTVVDVQENAQGLTTKVRLNDSMAEEIDLWKTQC